MAEGATTTGLEIAIVGMTGRFPGAPTIERLWSNLVAGVESIRPLSELDRLAAGASRTMMARSNYVNAAAVLDDEAMFDADAFSLSAREAELMDPQHRVFLECAVEALENAGYDPARFDGAIGVFAGAAQSGYVANLQDRPELFADPAASLQVLLGNDKDYLPSRVSYKLGLRGPSLAVQSACSTSLVAVHLASQSLLSGDCDMALAGGVAIKQINHRGYVHYPGGIFSADGHCRTFDAAASGTIFGNGIGIVVLKRLEDAIADRDCIRAVVKGSAVNNDGSDRIGYTAPSIQGQTDVLTRALLSAELDPASVDYIEAHGTGTALGDPIEMTAVARAYGHRDRNRHCAVGSVKSNLGHLETAAGIAGLIKAVLCVQHARLVPSLHFSIPNPEIDFEGTGYYVNTTCADWPSRGHARRAGVSSFGIGGTNAHVIIEESPVAQQPRPKSTVPQVFLLSARTGASLDAVRRRLADHFETEAPPVDASANTLQIGRAHHKVRASVTAANPRELTAALRTRRNYTSLPDGDTPEVVIGLGDCGDADAAVVRILCETEPTFRKAIERCGPRALSSELPAVARRFALDYAMTSLWRAWGLSPVALFGTRFGEWVAASDCGVMDPAQALAVIVQVCGRSARTPPRKLFAVAASRAAIERFDVENRLAAVNGPAACVVSVAASNADEFVRSLTDRGIRHVFVGDTVDYADARTLISQLELRPPSTGWLSASTGGMITREATDSGWWADQLTAPALLHDAVEVLRTTWPRAVLLEVGVDQPLTRLLARRGDIPVIAAGPLSGNAPRRTLMDAAGALWTRGVQIDWTRLHTDAPARVPLPTYPFERRCFWVERVRPSPLQPSLRASDGRSGRDDLAQICGLYRELLGVEAVEPDTDFFDAGGDSLLAVELAARLTERLSVAFVPDQLLEARTPAAVARIVGAPETATSSTLMRAGPSNDATPLVLIHAVVGDVFCYRDLVDQLPEDRTVLAIRAPGLFDPQPILTSVDTMADRYAAIVDEVLADRTVVLAGWSFGGAVALEVARRLGPERVQRVVMIDTWAPIELRGDDGEDDEDRGDDEDREDRIARVLLESSTPMGRSLPDNAVQITKSNLRAWRSYEPHLIPTPIATPIALIRAETATFLPAGSLAPASHDPSLGWSACGVQIDTFATAPGDHFSMVRLPHATTLAARLHQLCSKGPEHEKAG